MTPTQLPTDTYLTSSLLREAGFQHAFLTRLGGHSKGVFESLSFATNAGDNEDDVANNLEIVGRTFGIPSQHIYFLSQVHGTDVHIAAPTLDRSVFQLMTGDIVLAHEPNIAAAIRTADCVPVLIACKHSGWVAACHSGWQGCTLNAAAATVEALYAQGATELIAAIGPHISAEAFEVDNDVAEQLLNASPDKTVVIRSLQAPNERRKAHVDLRKMVRSQLTKSGLLPQNIDDVPGCTVLEPNRFFSYRRDKNPSGRMLSFIVTRTG